MLTLAENVTINENEIEFEFIKSSGPGGQKVNKTSSAVKLKFDLENAKGIPEVVKERIYKLGLKKVTRSGMIVIDARRYRSQKLNRNDAIQRLIKLIIEALPAPKKRKKTHRSEESHNRRLLRKKKRGEIKNLRKNINPDTY